MKKNIVKILSLAYLMLVQLSCAEFTDGINVDPNNFPGAPGNLLIGQANLGMVFISESQASRYSGLFTDQFTGSDRQFIPYDSYTVIASDFDSDWDDLYSGALVEARLAELDAVATGDPILEGVAQIAQALMFGEAAALWGDIPFTQALNYPAIASPIYDDQTFVFEEVQAMLDAAILKVGETPVTTYGSPVFVENSATWAEVANTLKARYYLITKDYANALTYSQIGISSRDGDLLASHFDAENAENLYYQFEAQERTGYLTADGSHLYNLTTGETDRVLATPGDSERAAVYFDGTNINLAEGGYFAVDASFPVVSWYETKLIEAEAAYRTGGDALTPFNEVRNELAAEYGGAFPETVSTGETLLTEILEEKYITLIGSLQVFHDVRRTENLIGVPIKSNTTTKIPQRFLYPQSEVSSNASFPGIVDLFEETEVNQ